MMDFIKSIDLFEDLKYNEIYNLFKTESSELNLEFLSILQRFNNINEYIKYFTKQNPKEFEEIFNNLISLSSKISENYTYKNYYEEYTSQVSTIIFLFVLIHKTNELFSNLIQSVKIILNDMKKNEQVPIKKITSYINDIVLSSQFIARRNFSRRSTQESTISSITTGLNKLKENEHEFILFQCLTPKFDEEDEKFTNDKINNKEEKKDINQNITEEIEYSNRTLGSTMSFRNMKFVYDGNEDNTRTSKKNKTVKMNIDLDYCSGPENYFKKKCFSNCLSTNIKTKFSKKLKKSKVEENKSNIIVDFLNEIGMLYKEEKISSKQKMELKQVIISDSEKINKDYINYSSNKKNKYDKHLFIEKCLKNFIEK